MRTAETAWTSAGRYGYEPIYAKPEKEQAARIVLFNTLAGPWTKASPHDAEPVEGTSAGPASRTKAPARQTTGEAILEIRCRSGLTWELLSKLFSVSRRTVHHWANGKAPSTQHERDIRETLDAIRHLDEGNRRATRDRLLTSVHGSSLFDWLADRRYTEVMLQAAGAGGAAFGRQRTALSQEESTRRRPAAPNLLLEAIQDRPKIAGGPVRIAQPTRRKKKSTE